VLRAGHTVRAFDVVKCGVAQSFSG